MKRLQRTKYQMKILYKQNIRWKGYNTTNKISDEKITQTKYQMKRL